MKRHSTVGVYEHALPRLQRIIPLYFVSMLVFCIGSSTYLSPADWKMTGSFIYIVRELRLPVFTRLLFFFRLRSNDKISTLDICASDPSTTSGSLAIP